MSSIQVKNITRTFGKTCALDDISLSLESDSIYGLLGRNGAGKTTLINIITNKIFTDSGEVTIDGEKARENDHAQSKIYCMTEKNVHLWTMKVRDGFRWAHEYIYLEVT